MRDGGYCYLRKRILTGLVTIIFLLNNNHLIVYADSFNPQETNSIYESFISGELNSKIDYEEYVSLMSGDYYDDALIWLYDGYGGWPCILLAEALIEDLCADLETFITEAPNCYMALLYTLPEGYSYWLLFQSGIKALLLVYIPATGQAFYEVGPSFAETLEELKANSLSIWEIKKDDFESLNEDIFEYRLNPKGYVPQNTNSAYVWLSENFREFYKEDLLSLDDSNKEVYDDSIIWSWEGWTRATLSSLLESDLMKADKTTYDSFFVEIVENTSVDATKCYVYLFLSSLQPIEYSYYVILCTDQGALGIYYTPSKGEAEYDKYPFFTSQLLERMRAKAIDSWEITEYDYEDALNKYKID